MIKLIIFILIFFSHVMAARPFFLQVRKGEIPNTSDFAAISIILYYDLGLGIETFSSSYENIYFIPFFHDNENTLIQGFILLFVAPWLFHLGSFIKNKKLSKNREQHPSYLKKSRQILFYSLTISISIGLAFFGYYLISQNQYLWVARQQIGEELGALVIILYLPMHFLSFYVRQFQANTKIGLFFCLLLALTSIMATIGIAQRTTILLPILIVVLFKTRISLSKLILFFIAGAIIAAAVLPIFKWQYASENYAINDLVQETIINDFYRGNILATTLEKAEALGTNIMPYPMSGYVYSLLFYIPRQIAPFKGWSTGQTFTSNIDKTRIEDTNWQFGIGVIEELLLNIGFWCCIPGLVVYGMCMSFLDKLSWRIPSLLISTRLAGIWLCGYELSTLILLFGTMAIVSLLLHYTFVDTNKSLF